MLKALHRRRVTKALRALVEQIQTLTGDTPGRHAPAPGSEPSYANTTTPISVDWEHADAVHDLALASGLPVTSHGRLMLAVGPQGHAVRIDLRIPLRVVALLLADILLRTDADLAAGIPIAEHPALTSGSVHEALTTFDPPPQPSHRTSGRVLHVITARHTLAVTRGQFGTEPETTPLTDMLATLLLDGAQLHGQTLADDQRLFTALSELHDALADRPSVVDTARALLAEPDAPARSVTVTPPHATGPARSAEDRALPADRPHRQ